MDGRTGGGRASREPRERALALARWAARSLAVIVVDPEDGGRAACDTTNNVRFARATGGIEGRRNKAKPLQLPLFYPLTRRSRL